MTKPNAQEYANDYTFRGDADYSPSEHEQMLITDALLGFECEMDDHVKALQAEIDALKAAQTWQPIESAPKGIKILLLFMGGSGKHRIVMACYYPPNTLPADEDSDDEYAPDGWYEECEFGDYVHGIDGDLVGWMPVPKAIAKATGGNHES